jgi:putative transposase
MKYEFIMNHRSQHRVKKMCRVLKVNESGYYRWKRRKPSQRELEEAQLVAVMREIHEAHKHTLGATRMQRELAKKGLACGLNKIRRLMRSNAMYTVYKCKYRPYPKEAIETTYSENLINQQFDVAEPNRCWAGDITYIRSEQGWVYLAAVLDLFNREAIGYAISRKADSELTKRALEQALLNRRRPKGLIFHSDRGTQYSSHAFQKYLVANGLTSSMSRKGTPYDNACCESFFATIKKEWIYWKKFANEAAVESGAFAYIDLFYNRKRMHSTLGYLSPYQYMKNFMATKAR